MLRITTKGRYALSATVDIARIHASGELAKIKDISQRINVSEKYLERLIGNLRENGILESVRGKYGGYRLNGKPQDITVYDVLVAAGEDLTLVECLSGGESCKVGIKNCTIHKFWEDLWDEIQQILCKVSLQQILDETIAIESQQAKN